jgi:DNA-binding LacI/PurR family transcriptional regulator
MAKEMGVAKLTVRRAFSKLVADGVVRSVERVGTFVAEAGEAKAKKVGLFLPAKDGFLEFGYLSGIREAFGSEKQLLLYGTDNDAVTEWEMLDKAADEVDGIIIMPTCHPRITSRLESLNENGCPVVCLDRVPAGSKLASATTDNYASTRGALEELRSRGHEPALAVTSESPTSAG